MKIFNCLIIEDQIPAQEILKNYIEQVPTLNLLEIFISPIDALSIIKNREVDILFLDIHLPKLSGIELIKSVTNLPNIIITTAFSDYAVEGFDLDVVDYLLKPFSFERFLKAISKLPSTDKKTNNSMLSGQIFIRSKNQIKNIHISNIDFIEAKGDFVLIYSKTSREMANITMSNLLSILDSNFTRCHKSYIVNLISINKIVANTIFMDGFEIPIGRSYKTQLINKLKLI